MKRKENNIKSSIYSKSIFAYVLLYILGSGCKLLGLELYLYPFIMLCFLFLLRISRSWYITGTKKIWEFIVIFCLMLGYTQLVNIICFQFSLNHTIKMCMLVLLVIIIPYFVQEKQIVNRIWTTLIIGVTISCCVAILQSIGLSLAVDIWHFKFCDNSERFYEIKDSLLSGRSAGLASYSLSLGFQIVQVFPVAFAGFFYKKRTKAIPFALIYTGILFLGCIATGMRMAVLICIFECALLIVLYHYDKRENVLKILMILIIVLPALVVLEVEKGYFTTFIRRMGVLISGEGGDISVRLDNYIRVLKTLFEQNPIHWLLGNGLNSYNDYKTIGKLGSAHNFILGNLFEFGLIGMSLVGITYYKLLFWLNHFHKDILAVSMSVGIIGYLITALTNDSTLLNGDLFHITFLVFTIMYLEVLQQEENKERCKLITPKNTKYSKK